MIQDVGSQSWSNSKTPRNKSHKSKVSSFENFDSLDSSWTVYPPVHSIDFDFSLPDDKELLMIQDVGSRSRTESEAPTLSSEVQPNSETSESRSMKELDSSEPVEE
eukprot:Tbor_TRINITY_DN4926_c0_g2::TRINITY_DN4926_c0_g2_i1::g.10010::m.10010